MRVTTPILCVALVTCLQLLAPTVFALPAWRDTFLPADSGCNRLHQAVVKQAYTFMHESLSNPLEIAVGPEAGMDPAMAATAFARAEDFFSSTHVKTKTVANGDNPDRYMECFYKIRRAADEPRFYCSPEAFQASASQTTGASPKLLASVFRALDVSPEQARERAQGWAAGEEIAGKLAKQGAAVDSIEGGRALAQRLAQEFQQALVFVMAGRTELCGLMEPAQSIKEMAAVLIPTMFHEFTHSICKTNDEMIVTNSKTKKKGFLKIRIAEPTKAYGALCDINQKRCKKAHISKAARQVFIGKSITNADSYAQLFASAHYRYFKRVAQEPRLLQSLKATAVLHLHRFHKKLPPEGRAVPEVECRERPFDVDEAGAPVSNSADKDELERIASMVEEDKKDFTTDDPEVVEILEAIVKKDSQAPSAAPSPPAAPSASKANSPKGQLSPVLS